MKLIFCIQCHDVVKCLRKKRYCDCGASWGKYHNDIDASYGGLAVPLGFANSSLTSAILSQPETGHGRTFTAFVIPKKCATYIEEEE